MNQQFDLGGGKCLDPSGLFLFKAKEKSESLGLISVKRPE